MKNNILRIEEIINIQYITDVIKTIIITMIKACGVSIKQGIIVSSGFRERIYESKVIFVLAI